MKQEITKGRYSISLMVIIAGLFIFTSTLVCFAEEYQYIGLKKCTKCHKGEKKGMQKEIWEKGPHSKAYEILLTDKARETAKKAGITGDPAEAGECLKCHTTGYGLPESRFEKGYVKTDGVTCEACHGPGSGYWKAKTMKDHALSVAGGLTEISEKTCKRCHTAEGNPNFTGFDYEEYMKKIAHPVPDQEG